MQAQCRCATLCLAILLAVPAFAGALWDAPEGPAAAEEVPPMFDRDAGARRRILEAVTRPAPAPNTSKMWNAPIPSPHIVRRGTIMDVSEEESMKDLEPTLVSVSIQDMAAESALDELSEALKIPMRMRQANLLRQSGSAPVTLELKDVPILEALLEFNSQTALTMDEMTSRRITLNRVTEPNAWGGPGSAIGSYPGIGVGTWCISGPFAVIIESLQNSVDLRRGRAGAEAQMTMSFLAEPTLNVVQYPHYLHVDMAIDDLDQQIGITPPGEDRGSRQNNQHRLVLPLKLPDKPGQRLRLLRGTAEFSLARDFEHIVVATPAVGLNKPTDTGITVEVMPIPNGGGNNVNLTVRYHRSSLDEDLWKKLTGPLLDLVPQVMTVSGQPYSSFSGNARMPTADTVEVQRNYYDSGGGRSGVGPEKILIDIPIGVRQIHVPFEFKNLILP